MGKWTALAVEAENPQKRGGQVVPELTKGGGEGVLSVSSVGDRPISGEISPEQKASKGRVLSAPEPTPDPAAEKRRARVLTMLEAHPGAKYAAVTDMQVVPGFVLLTLAIRDVATVDLLIPAAKWDGPTFLDLLEKHGHTLN